jgi:hypothetical protein
MLPYRLYLVGTVKIKPGKHEEAVRFWREKGMPDILAEPWTESLKTYAAQFGLGGQYTIEVWQEIKNYAALDQMDQDMIDNPGKYREKRELWREAEELFEWGPSRLMGDWPESSLQEEEE